MPKTFTPKLSPRLEGIVSMVPKGSKTADIGCDHGYISIALVQRGIAESSIASDIRSGPLAQAEKNVGKAGLEDKIRTRLAPGISGLASGEADVIIIAGMGQRTIAEILSDDMEPAKEAKYLILQPQSEIPEMRDFLKENGFTILQNKMIREEEKYYFAMLVSYGEKDLPNDAVNISAALVERMEMNAQPEFAETVKALDRLFGMDLICSEPEMAYYLNFVEREWSEALEKLHKAKKPDFQKIAEIEAKASAAKLALEMNMSFCKTEEKFRDIFE